MCVAGMADNTTSKHERGQHTMGHVVNRHDGTDLNLLFHGRWHSGTSGLVSGL